MPNLGPWTLSVDNPPLVLFGDRSGHVELVKKDQMVAEGVEGRTPVPIDEYFQYHSFEVSTLGVT